MGEVIDIKSGKPIFPKHLSEKFADIGHAVVERVIEDVCDVPYVDFLRSPERVQTYLLRDIYSEVTHEDNRVTIESTTCPDCGGPVDSAA